MPSLPPEVEAVRAAYDAPVRRARRSRASPDRASSRCRIPVHDHARGNGDAQAAHFAAINATPLPVHFVWGLADDVFPGTWGRRWHARIPHSTWDAFDDAAHFLQDTHGDRIAQAVLDRISP